MTVTDENHITKDAIHEKAAELRSAANAAQALIDNGHRNTAREMVNICRFAAADLIVMLNDEVPHE